MLPTKPHRLPAFLRGARCLLAVLVASLGYASFCRAESILPAIYPSEDRWVKESAPTVNQTAANLTATNAAGASKIIFVRFSIPQSYYDDGNTLLRKATPRKAVLRLTRAAGSGGVLNVYAAGNIDSSGNPWTSNSITFNNKPIIHSGVANLLAPGQTFVNTTDYVFSFDVTDYISGPGEYTFCVRCSNTTSDVSLYGSTATSARKPALFLTAPTPPGDPASIVYPASPPAPPRTEFDRLIRDVVRRGDAYKARYVALNASNNGDYDVNLVGYFDVTKSPYNAKGDWTSANNGNDDTVAIQRAINEARDARMAVYFPAEKKFRVTAPLECVQGVVLYENDKQLEYDAVTETWVPPAASSYYLNSGYERWNHREFPCVIMGPALPLNNSSRPKLIAGIGKFGNASSPVALLHFWSRGTGEGTDNPPTENYPAASYNHLVRNVDIDLRGRPGAIGINMVGAQGTAIESLKITATNSYAGISGLPGAGGCTSAVTIDGGKYGIDAYKTTLDGGTGITSVLNYCTINGTTNTDFTQTNSIRWNHYGPLVLVGCDIKGGPVEIAGSGDESIPTGTQDGPTSRGNLSIADSKIEMIVPGPAVTGSRSAYLRNVYLKNVTAVAGITTTSGSGSSNPAVPTSDWFLVKEYSEGAVLDQYVGRPTAPPDQRKNYSDDGVGAEPTPIYVNGQPQPGVSIKSSFVAGAPASNFLEKHKWPEAIDWEGSDVINVKNQLGLGGIGDKPTVNAVGNNAGDDWKAIDEAIVYAKNNNKKIFIPAGQYLLNDPLVLKDNTVLFGIHRNYSVLKANDHPLPGGPETETSFDDNAEAALIITPADTNNDHTTKLADLMLLQRMTAVKTYLLDWNAGDNSVVQNVNFNRQSVNAQKFGGAPLTMTIPLIKIGTTGGGKWYSMFHLSGGNAGPGYRNIKILGSELSLRRIKFYMFNPEIDSGANYNAEIVGRSNLDIFGSKAEGRHTPFVRLAACVDVRWFGFGGNAYCNEFEVDSNEAQTNATIALSQAVVEIEDCPSIVLSSSSFYPNFLKPDGVDATDPLTFYRLKEKVGANYNTTPGHLGFVFFRRDPGGSGINDDN